jgi:glycyl-tRNA synthetase beta chain
MSQPLLIELGTEELPPKALPELAQAFFDGVLAGFDKRGIGFDREGARALYSPRRLAVLVAKVESGQPTQKSEVLGPYLNIGLDAEGQPTPALLGFAGKNGVRVEQLQRITDNKGERFVARSETPGASLASLLPELVADALKALPVPKPMRWGSRNHAFVRPVHWLLLLHGEQVVDGEVLGLKADRMSRGHRFHADKPVWISRPEDYIDALRRACVLVDPEERRERVRTEIEAAAAQVDGVARVPEALLEEVNCLVEWPKAVLCSFEREFLRVPQEALISTMEGNQKFFPVLNAEHRLTEHFIGLANIESRDQAEVRKGYERVIRPRFADAQFFFDEDRKQGLAAMAEGLKTVTYQQKLGSYADKTDRVILLADRIAQELGVDREQARRAAALAKADLQSRLVGEFPELQGIAGRHYATAAGETGAVADAIDQAYMPRYAGDAIAASRLGQVLAIAERLDTLAGGFAAGLKPTGNKDPFALRRNALGLARTLIEGELDLDLMPLLACARDGVGSVTGDKGPAFADVNELREFILDRLRGYYAEQGFTAAQFDAIAAALSAAGALASANLPANSIALMSAPATATISLFDFDRRLRAIREFAQLPEAEALAAANKRIRNILRKTDEAIPAQVNPQRLEEPGERALNDAVNDAIADTDPMLADRDYVGVLKRLAALRAPVDAFFDGVMVLAEDAELRHNRRALLKRLADRFATVAEVAMLA